MAVTTALALVKRDLDRVPSPSSPSPSNPQSSSPPLSPSLYSTPTELESKSKSNEAIAVKGVVAFYPLLDFSTPRSVKLDKSAQARARPGIIKPLPGWMTRLFDTSYLPRPSLKEGGSVIDRTHPLISPLLATDRQIAKFPSIHLCLCEADVLAQEGQEFADRLSVSGGSGQSAPTKDAAGDIGDGTGGRRGKGEGYGEGGGQGARDVVCRWVQGARHGWDKPPHLVKPSVKDEYDAAVDSINRWCA